MTTTKTTKPATTTTDTKPARQYFAGKSAEQIAATLKTQAKKVATSLETFGGMIIEAHALQVHVQLDLTWSEFCEQTLAGFRPDTLGRKVLVAMMRQAGMENRDVASATGSSTATVERDNAQAGNVNASKQAANKQAAARNAKPADAKQLDSKIVAAYLHRMSSDQAATVIRLAGHSELLRDEYKHDVTVPTPSKADHDKVRSIRTAGQHRTPIRRSSAKTLTTV